MSTPVSIIYVSEFFAPPLRCGFPILNIPILLTIFAWRSREKNRGSFFLWDEARKTDLGRKAGKGYRLEGLRLEYLIPIIYIGLCRAEA